MIWAAKEGKGVGLGVGSESSDEADGEGAAAVELGGTPDGAGLAPTAASATWLPASAGVGGSGSERTVGSGLGSTTARVSDDAGEGADGGVAGVGVSATGVTELAGDASLAAAVSGGGDTIADAAGAVADVADLADAAAGVLEAGSGAASPQAARTTVATSMSVGNEPRARARISALPWPVARGD